MRIMIVVIAVMVVSVLSIAIMSPSSDGNVLDDGHLQASIRQTAQN
ncbi:hypothetical protein [Rhizobium sp. Root708]|nr:hypothetical protein [Rhizobium sp. Root708]